MGDDHFLNLQPGTIVNGRYEIVKCLGTGSMGMVYACRHRELSGHLVAMKVLFAEVARDEVAAARFKNEIVASYGVNHPNVVRAYEYFKDGDLVAFTMEFVGGGDLADRIGENRPIPSDEICRMLIQMCSGVEAIHDAGIIHRDLKPENILLTGENDIKITDFGIARTGTGPKLTEYGGVVGTIDYVSPEYLERGQVDTRSDIYSLGVLAYEMITGDSPFKGKSVIETMTMRLRSDPEPPASLRSDCPEEISRIVLKALARNPEERYQTAHEMMEDLLDYSEETVQRYDRRRQVPSPSSRPLVAKSEKVAAAEIPSEQTAAPKVVETAEDEAVAPAAHASVREEVYEQKDTMRGARQPLGAAQGDSGGMNIAPMGAEGGEKDVDYLSSLDAALSSSTEAAQSVSEIDAEIDDELQGTVLLDSEDVSKIKDSFARGDAELEDLSELENMLSRESKETEDPSGPSLPLFGSVNSGVHISHGRLSQDRLKELSTGVYGGGDDSILQSVVWWFLIIVLGFGVGLFFISYYTPGIFDGVGAASFVSNILH